MRQPIVISSTARLEQLECRLLFDGVGAAHKAHLMPALMGDSLAPVSVLFIAPDGTDANDGLASPSP